MYDRLKKFNYNRDHVISLPMAALKNETGSFMATILTEISSMKARSFTVPTRFSTESAILFIPLIFLKRKKNYAKKFKQLWHYAWEENIKRDF